MDTTGLGEIIERSSAGMWSWDLFTGETEFSDLLIRTLGLSDNDLGSGIEFWFQLLHPDELELIKRKLFRCTDGTEPVFSAQHRIRHKSGDWIVIQSTGGLVPSKDDESISRFLCIQNTVHTGSSSIDFLNLRSVLSGVLTEATDLQGAMVGVNEILARLSIVDACGFYLADDDQGDLTLAEYSGLPQWYIELRSHVKRSSGFGEIIDSGKAIFPVYSERSPFREENSSHRSIFINAVFPFRFTDSGDGVLFIASKHLDGFPESARREMEGTASLVVEVIRKLRQLERMSAAQEKYMLLLEMIGNPVIALSDGMKVQFCNRALERLLDVQEGTLPGKGIDEILHGELWRAFSDCMRQVLATGEVNRKNIEFEERFWEISISRSDDGFLTVLRNMTAHETAREKLAYRERFEKLLIRISTGFIEIKGYTLNRAINDAILEIGMMIGADRAFLFKFEDNFQKMSSTHEWCAFNVEPRIEKYQNLICSDFPWWMERIRKLRTVLIPLVEDLPPEAEAEKEFLSEMNILSQVLIPLVYWGDLNGFMGFDSISRPRTWSEDIIDLLRIASDAIANALERNRMENQLREMYEKVERDAEAKSVLLREVNHRVKNNLSEIIGLLYAQMRYAKKTERQTDFIPSLIDRIQGLATVHSMLSNSGWRPLSISDLIRQIMDNSIANMPSDNRIETDVSDSPLTVDSNKAHALTLIFNELVRNSLKHSGELETLSISVVVKSGKNGVNIRYSDNGPGYSDDVLDLRGIGLGLSLVKNIVSKNLHGHLELRNEEGAVAEIIFALNLQEEDDG